MLRSDTFTYYVLLLPYVRTIYSSWDLHARHLTGKCEYSHLRIVSCDAIVVKYEMITVLSLQLLANKTEQNKLLGKNRNT